MAGPRDREYGLIRRGQHRASPLHGPRATIVLVGILGICSCAGERGAPADEYEVITSYSRGELPDSGRPRTLCEDFSDLLVEELGPGSTLNGPNFTMRTRPLAHPDFLIACTGVTFPHVVSASHASEAWTNGCLLEFFLPETARYLAASIATRGGVENLMINQRIEYWPRPVQTSMAEVEAGELGDVLYRFLPSAPGAQSGTLLLSGFIRGFAIGGQEMTIDDVCYWNEDCSPATSPLSDSLRSPFGVPQGTKALTEALGVEATLLSDRERRLTHVVIEGLSVPARTVATIEARVFRAGFPDPVPFATGSTVVRELGREKKVQVPIDTILPARGRFVFAFHVDSTPPATIEYALKGVSPFIEDEGVFRVEAFRTGSPPGGYPTSLSNSAVRMSVITACP